MLTGNVALQEAVRRRLEAQQDRLSPYAVRDRASRGRNVPEQPPLWRTEFQRDRDRVLHTNAFRRLKHKTQVFIAPLGDHYITRLTHTLEVAQIARTIARALNLSEDLAEAVALAHDLGHTPFGHVGEATLDRLVPGGFRHADQSLRIVDLLEKDGQGLNLTWEVRQGIVAHSKPRGDFLKRRGLDGLTLEAQVCRLSDAVAYLNHDIRDALRARLLSPDDLPPGPKRLMGVRPSERLNALVTDVVESSWAATGEGGPSSGAAPSITMSPRMRRALTQLREFMFEWVYLPISRAPESQKAQEIVGLLYRHYCAHQDELPPQYAVHGGPAQRQAADYVAGMTDHFALQAAERIQPGISQGVRFMGL
ncbi:MAG: deoxyguanosinetriphosphate triphosphohydrolase [Chloroflexi bacterium]|nr:deoxyguanosinetriphosphate triphosphohydrolase [Chloroflexota bacterium]